MPVVMGDGRRTLDELILADPRAVAMAATYLDAQEARLREVIPEGERVQLVELGTHARGAYFLDGALPPRRLQGDRTERRHLGGDIDL